LFTDLEGLITCKGSLSLEGWDTVVRVESESCDMRVSLTEDLEITVSESPDDPSASELRLVKPSAWECVFSEAKPASG
jgi:hypothetical protein